MAEGHGVQTGGGGTRRMLAVAQQELALMIGISWQTTNEILKGMEARGILQVRRGGWRYWICQNSEHYQGETYVCLSLYQTPSPAKRIIQTSQ